MTLLIIYGFVSILFSFLCSILEAVLLSVTDTFINVKISEQKTYAIQLRELKKDVDKPLIAILTLNTIAHTVGAILVGVQAEKTFGTGNNMVMIVSAVMTLLILVLSEIIPKTIGATYWKGLANFTAKSLKLMIFPLKYTGILWFLQLTTKLIGKSHHGSVLTREDFSVMADMAHQEGVFEESESKVIKNLLNFKRILAKDIMTPRSVIQTASAKVTLQEYYDKNPTMRFSRIPLYQDRLDNISAYFLKDELYKMIADGNGTKTLADIGRKLVMVNRSTPVPELFDQMVSQREHIALVVDEYGSVSGLVTMEDIVETLLGLEIVDEFDKETDMQVLARKNWEERAKKLGLLENQQQNS